MKRALITGGAGFIGSHVVKRFHAGGWLVHAVDNLAYGRRASVGLEAEFHLCDAGTAAMRQVVQATTPDVVVHLAADAGSAQRKDAIGLAARDAEVSRNVFSAAFAVNPRVRVVFASTVGIHGDGGGRWVSPYAKGKRDSELALARAARVAGGTSASLRLANVYGPGQTGSSGGALIPSLIDAVIHGRPMRLFGDGEQTRDFVHVTDAANAVWLAATADRSDDGPVDICTGIATCVRDVARLVARLANQPPRVEFADGRGDEIRHSRPDPRPAQRTIGWQSEIPLDRGLGEVLAQSSASVQAAVESLAR